MIIFRNRCEADPGQGVALAMVAKARDIMKVHCMLALPSEEITQKRLRQWKS